jgi:dTDP-glucose 4,6-dehydratase
MRAVVLGGAGFIGSSLCDRLLDDNHEVLCIDNLITGSLDNLDKAIKQSNFQFKAADVTTGVAIDGPVDAVLHFASLASPTAYAKFPFETLRVGSLGTFWALELARAKSAHFVFASSSEVYGVALSHPQCEDYHGNVDPVAARAVYSEAKRFAETLTATYARQYSLQTTIVRIFNTYGPRMNSGDGRVIPTLLQQANRGEPLSVTGDGQQTRSFCYIDDLVAAMTRVLAVRPPGPLNLGNPEEITILSLAHLILQLTSSQSTIASVPRPPDDIDRRKPDISLAKRVLDWEPVVGLEEGIINCLAGLRKKSR